MDELRFNRRTFVYRREPRRNDSSKRLALWAIVVIVAGASLGLGLLWIRQSLTERFDILIINGLVIDGTGAEGRRETVGIRDGRIVPVEWPVFAEADKTIDADGLVVAPGFIDVHTHIEGNVSGSSRDSPLAAPNFISQGITTIITGNCGRSALSIADFFSQLQQRGVEVNVASLVGHNTIRRKVMGDDARAPTDEEIKEMRNLVRRAMRDGALGLSTGLEYTPGAFADVEEVKALVEVAARYHGIYATHMRDEGNDVVKSIEEALAVARETQAPLEISHLKWRGRANWGRSLQLIAMIAEAKKSGLKVSYDVYPYTASSTSLDILIPKSAREGGGAKLRERLTGGDTRARVIEGTLAQMKSEGWEDFSFARVAYCEFAPEFNGLSIPQITALLHQKKISTSAAIPPTVEVKQEIADDPTADEKKVETKIEEKKTETITQKEEKPDQDEKQKTPSLVQTEGDLPKNEGTNSGVKKEEAYKAASEKTESNDEKKKSKPVTKKPSTAVKKSSRQKSKATTAKRKADSQKNKTTAKQNLSRSQSTKSGQSGNKEEPTFDSASARSQAEAICYLAARGGAQMIYENMSEEDVIGMLRFPDCMLGSDSGIRTGDGRPHPRGYGSAPRLIGVFAIERAILSLEEAVRRMTSLPAETFGISERGRIAPGYWADIVIFDPSAIRDRATYEEPFQSPDGIRFVLVNGRVAREGAQSLSLNAGRVLRREFD
jgi:N-acyl-D-aspartate/D-glutamate deacylase